MFGRDANSAESGPGLFIEVQEIIFRTCKKNNMALVPFLLQCVGGVRVLNQQYGIHPTAEGAKIVAQNVWSVLQAVLRD